MHPAETSAVTGKRGVAAQAAALDPLLLTFEDDHTFVSNGHLVVSLTYPSDSAPGHRYSLAVRGDGTLIAAGNHDDTCPGFRRYGACLHTRGTEEMVREYWRRHFRALPAADLVREDSWLAHQPAGSLDAAQGLQLDGLGDVLAERATTQSGRAA